jgi:hypothetical protein
VREVVTRPDPDRVLRGLRNFQRATVDHVFERLYGANDPVTRFLVADEVGLGKTLVARGLIAKVVDKLWDKMPRIDVVYICSNASIARQNVSRLNITDSNDIALPSRITLLPARIKDLQRNRLNFVSFTPGTSFNLRSSLGTAEERALLYWLVPDSWKENRYAAVTLFAGSAGRAGFESRLNQVDRAAVNEPLRDRFRKELESNPAAAPGEAELGNEPRPLLSRFGDLCSRVGRRVNLDDDERRERDSIIGELRSALAANCVESLEPDLIILDEFQRFKDLLVGEDEASSLARRLFTYSGTRVLLLSATPYKMYTLNDEVDGDDHFADFVQTISFLQNDPGRTEEFRETLAAYRRELCQYGTGDMCMLVGARDRIQATLRRVVVRTERLAVTADRNGMLKDVPARHAPLLAGDIEQYLALQRISRVVGGGDTIEYWKSSPYILNFMEDYDLKRRFKVAAESAKSPDLFEAVAAASTSLLSSEDIGRYARIDPGNARLRSLIADLDDCGAWDVCWIPPSLPYYRCEGPFAGRPENLTKRLIFSTWQVVPKAVATLLTYEAERRLSGVEDMGADGANTLSTREKHRGLLRFSLKDGHAANMTVLGMVYPGFTLASHYDPLDTALRLQEKLGGVIPSLADVVADTAARLVDPLRQLVGMATEGGSDDRWYWAAPVLLDLSANADAARRWLAQSNLKELWHPPTRAQAGPEVEPDASDEGESKSDAWHAHVDEVRKLVDSRTLGAQPADLAGVIALLAIAGFGVTALRTLV